VNVLDSAFRRQLERLNDQHVDAIVRVTIPLDQAQTMLASRGFRVQRVLRLIQGVAVSAPAHLLLALSHEPWVRRIEPDRPVHTHTS